MEKILNSKFSIKSLILTFVLLISAAILLTACSNNSDKVEKDLPVYESGSIALVPQDEDFHDFERPYRLQYYGCRLYELSEFLLDEKQLNDYCDWSNKYYKETNCYENLEEMIVVSYVKRYNIAREDFEKAVEALLKKDKQDGDLYATDGRFNERNEPLNAEIIYTFNNDIIDEYYRYE